MRGSSVSRINCSFNAIAILVGQHEPRPAGMLAGDGAHRQNAHIAFIARTVEHAADFDAAARKALITFRYLMPDLLDHHQRIVDDDGAFGYTP